MTVRKKFWLDKSGKHRKIRLYAVWSSMRYRCNNPSHKSYQYYGGKGVSVTPDWDDFDSFRQWALQSGYRKGLSIDRIDGNGDYTPDNCRWATVMQQSRNKPHHNHGADNGRAKLTEDQVREIRASKLSGPKLAKKYGIVHSQIYEIRSRKSWANVT